MARTRRLPEYERKRDFTKTKEPPPGPVSSRSGRPTFMVHKHHATALHYDLRLEMDDALASWAVPKGPSYDPAVKRLAVQTEDHPLEYGGFEGRIPDDEYGGGDSLIWDRGTYDSVPPGQASEQRQRGRLHIELDGEKLKGQWHLVRTGMQGGRGGGKPQWLLFKASDATADPKRDIVVERPESVVSGRIAARGPERAATLRAVRPPPDKLLARFIPPMLATLAGEPPPDPEAWIAEVKYDGFRVLAGLSSGRVAMLSRNGLDLAGRFPEIAEALGDIVVGDAVIDGEAVAVSAAGGGEFQRLQQSGAETAYFAFDLLYLNGEDLRDRPLEERRDLLVSLLSNAPPVLQLAERVPLPPAEALEEARRRGLEGVIVKRRGGTWTAGRSREWLKLKAQNSQELAIVGYLPIKPTAKTKTGGLGALLLAVAEKGGGYRFAGKVGTGFSNQVRTQLKKLLDKDRVDEPPARDTGRIGRAVWARPRLVGQVSFTEWTDDGKLRHPSFQGLRLDKKPEECVREKPTRVTKSAAGARKKATRTKRATTKKTTARKTAAKKAAGRGARPAGDDASRVESAAVEVKLTNPAKVLYPADGITKADVAAYYEVVAPAMLAALAGRPLSLQHWPAGIDKPMWFHQNMERDAPAWMHLVETPTSTKRGRIKHMVADRPESLRWIAQQNALTVHMWSSREGTLTEPDWVLFDLDPAEGRGIDQAVEAALRLKPLLDELGLESVIKTSGKRGLHVFVPLGPGHSHEQTTDFAVRLGEGLVAQVPELLTLERSLAKRNGRLYFDCFQNGYGKTVVAPYSTRAAPGAPVSAPLEWSEVNARLDPRRFTVKTMPARLGEKGDLFAPALRGRQKLPKLR